MAADQPPDARQRSALTFSLRTLLLIVMMSGVFIAGARSGDESIPGVAIGVFAAAGFLWIWFSAAILASAFWPTIDAARNDPKH
jgi:hypothetical protein